MWSPLGALQPFFSMVSRLQVHSDEWYLWYADWQWLAKFIVVYLIYLFQWLALNYMKWALLRISRDKLKGAMEEAFLSLKRVICQVRVPAFPFNSNFFIVKTIKKWCRDQRWYLILLSRYIGDNNTQPIKTFASL